MNDSLIHRNINIAQDDSTTVTDVAFHSVGTLERISAIAQLYLYTLIGHALSTNDSMCYIQTLL